MKAKIPDFLVPVIYAIMLVIFVLLIAIWFAGCSININLAAPAPTVLIDTVEGAWY